MAMGAVKGQGAAMQVEMVCLDELVPEDDRYRRLDRVVDWSFARELAARYYAEDVGRPSIDPIVLVKLMVAGALEGIGSTRELLRQASMDRQADRASGLMGVAGLPGQIPCGVTRVSTPVAGNMAGNLRFDPRRRFPDPRPARSPGLYQVVLLTIRARLLLVPTRSQRIDDPAGREGAASALSKPNTPHVLIA